MTPRRLAVVATIVALVAACADTGRGGDAGRGDAATVAASEPTTGATSEPTAPTADPRPTPPAPSPTGPPPSSAPWRAADDEVLPAAKELATGLVERLTNYDAGAGPAVPAAITSDRDRADALGVVAGPLLHGDRWSRGTVHHAQLGGHADDRASVMVVVEQRSGDASGELEVVTRTVDVRLGGGPDGWAVDAVASVGGEPVVRPDDLPGVAAAVLDDPRIRLPDSTRWDIHAGEVHPALLRVMLEIAERTPYDVVTISNGHPQHVFGTTKVSDHTVGRAVDIAAVDGVPVVSLREEGSPAYALVDWLRGHPDVRQVGSPWALDGYGGRSFTDLVHQDHLHVAVVADDRDVEVADG